jgi:ubiquitin carboxyl-terminal hydrolase 25/28
LENEVDNAFKEYKNFPYFLHAILIHDGNAESGHYYTFIFDRVADKWWRYNDFQVSEETEENVMSESFGDNNNSCQKTAYSLIYINEYIESQFTGSSLHLWGSGVPKSLNINEDDRSTIMKQNNKFK